jgi:hypothetical protein
MPQPIAVRERLVGEVVERTLTCGRLVDGLDDDRLLGRRAGQPDLAEHRVIRRTHDPPDDLDVALAQGLERLGQVDHGRSAAVS